MKDILKKNQFGELSDNVFERSFPKNHRNLVTVLFLSEFIEVTILDEEFLLYTRETFQTEKQALEFLEKNNIIRND